MRRALWISYGWMCVLGTAEARASLGIHASIHQEQRIWTRVALPRLSAARLISHAQRTGQLSATQRGFDSPHAALTFYLEHVSGKHYRPQLAGRLFFHPKRSDAKATELALRLKHLLDGEGLRIEVSQAPRTQDSLGMTTYAFIAEHPSIYLTRRPTGWAMADESVRYIQDVHRRLFPFGLDALVLRLDTWRGRITFGGIPLWRLLALFVVSALCVLGCVALRRLLTWIGEYILRSWMTKHKANPLKYQPIYPMVLRYLSWSITLWVAQMVVPRLQLPAQLSHYLNHGLQIAAALFITIAAYRSVDMGYVYAKKWTDKTLSKWDDQVLILSRKVLKVLFLILGTWMCLDVLNVSILPLLTGLSIGGLAFALAAQDMIKNFFGSVMIFLDKPFRIGDWIQYEGINGVVEEVGFRSTRIRTFADSVVAIPNAKLSDNVIDNFGLRVYRRYNTELQLLYENTPKQIDSFILALRAIVARHSHTPTDRAEIHLHKLTQTGVVILFYVFFKATNWSEELQARHEINSAILRAAETLSIRFSSQTELSLHRPPARASFAKKSVPSPKK